MNKKKFSEEPLKDFYTALVDKDEDFLKKVHIPHSSVFMAREAYFHYSGEWISLEQMEQAMLAEGLLDDA